MNLKFISIVFDFFIYYNTEYCVWYIFSPSIGILNENNDTIVDDFLVLMTMTIWNIFRKGNI